MKDVILKKDVDCPVCGYPATKTENIVDNSYVCECPWCGTVEHKPFDKPVKINKGYGSAHFNDRLFLFHEPISPSELVKYCRNAEETGGSVFSYDGKLIAECGELPKTIEEHTQQLCNECVTEESYCTDFLNPEEPGTKSGIEYT